MGKHTMNPKSLENLHGFRPGFDERRNIGGRPRSPMTAALRAKADEVAPDAGGKTYAELAADALFQAALKGSPAAFEAITDRIEGKARQHIEQTMDLNVGRTLPPLTEEEYLHGLGPGRGFCNEWFLRLTDEQRLRELEKIQEVLRAEVDAKAGGK